MHDIDEGTVAVIPKRRIALISCTAFLLMCLAPLPWIAATGQRSLRAIAYSQFLDQIHSGTVASVVIHASNSGAVEATYRLKDGLALRTVLPSDYKDALHVMQDKFVNVEIRGSSAEPLQSLLNVMPVFCC
jgi:hypothetical protein